MNNTKIFYSIFPLSSLIFYDSWTSAYIRRFVARAPFRPEEILWEWHADRCGAPFLPSSPPPSSPSYLLLRLGTAPAPGWLTRCSSHPIKTLLAWFAWSGRMPCWCVLLQTTSRAITGVFSSEKSIHKKYHYFTKKQNILWGCFQ